MNEGAQLSYWPAAGSSFWFGILTAISPCPLASNLVAVSAIVRDPGRPWKAMVKSLSYVLGRSLTYVALAALVISGILTIPGVAGFLQDSMGKILGPLLILIGILLLDVLPWNIPNVFDGERFRAWGEKGVILGPGLLGAVFALSFCPVSAGLYFGGLIPLAATHSSRVLMPALYGLGTGLPVAGFALLIVLGVNWAGRFFSFLDRAQIWMMRATAVLFMAGGFYYLQQAYWP
jgi:cytochrome c-type biogenesis protein